MHPERTTLARSATPLLMVLCLLIPAAPATAEVFQVTDIVDAIPAPVGSLRWAIEKSEQNGVPDRIEFLIDGGTIELVAALPDLAEGELRIGDRRSTGEPTLGNGIAISGINGVTRAIAIASKGNLIADLDFVEFAGSEVILLRGGDANHNAISSCGFGRDNSTGGNTGPAIRLVATAVSLGTPTGNEIAFNRFLRNGVAVLIEGDGSATDGDPFVNIHDNAFGTGPNGGPGPGNGEAIRAFGAGRVLVVDNAFSGPGAGIHLGSGCDGSTIVGNRIGTPSADGTLCGGFTGAGVSVEDSTGVTVRDNTLSCNDVGVHLGPGADRAQLHANRIGGSSPEGQRDHGVLLDPGDGALVRNNRISGNAGFGISSTASPVIDPSPGALLVCNNVWRNAGGALNLPGVLTAPPQLTSATVLQVNGDMPDPVTGWVETFGDDDEQARVFQGALAVEALAPGFRHRLPVLGLRLAKTATGTEISFDRTVPTNHTATLSEDAEHETGELSAPLPAATAGIAFDLVRGRLSNLAFGPDGIELGPVVCLDSGISPDIAVSPDVVDPEVPNDGEGFFYVARRRDGVNDAQGTYDPAICLTDVDDFQGPRVAGVGDCP